MSQSAVKVLARLAAKKAVQAELKEAGIRVSLVKPAVISERAQVYLQEHPELIAQAKPKVERMILAGVVRKACAACVSHQFCTTVEGLF
jgi:hypothetical protein